MTNPPQDTSGMKEQTCWWNAGLPATPLSCFDRSPSLSNAIRSTVSSTPPSHGYALAINIAPAETRDGNRLRSCMCANPDCKNIISFPQSGSTCIYTCCGNQSKAVGMCDGAIAMTPSFCQSQNTSDFVCGSVLGCGNRVDATPCNLHAHDNWTGALGSHPAVQVPTASAPAHTQIGAKNCVESIDAQNETCEEVMEPFESRFPTSSCDLHAHGEECATQSGESDKKVMIDLLFHMWRHGKTDESTSAQTCRSKCSAVETHSCAPSKVDHDSQWGKPLPWRACESSPPSHDCSNACSHCTVNNQHINASSQDAVAVGREADPHCSASGRNPPSTGSRLEQHALLNHLKKTVEKLQQNYNELYWNCFSDRSTDQNTSQPTSGSAGSEKPICSAGKRKEEFGTRTSCPVRNLTVEPGDDHMGSAPKIDARSRLSGDCVPLHTTSREADVPKPKEYAAHISAPPDVTPFYTGHSLATYIDNDAEVCVDKDQISAAPGIDTVDRINRCKEADINDLPSSFCPFPPATLTASSPPVSGRSANEGEVCNYGTDNGLHSESAKDEKVCRKLEERSPHDSFASFLVCSPDSSLTRPLSNSRPRRSIPLTSPGDPVATGSDVYNVSPRLSDRRIVSSDDWRPLTRNAGAAQRGFERRIVSPSPRGGTATRPQGERISSHASVGSERDPSGLVHTDNSPPRRRTANLTLPGSIATTFAGNDRRSRWSPRRRIARPSSPLAASSRYVSPIPHEVRTVLQRDESLTMLDAHRRNIGKLSPQPPKDNSIEHVFARPWTDEQEVTEGGRRAPTWIRYQRGFNTSLSNIPPDTFRPSRALSSRDYMSPSTASWDASTWRGNYVGSRKCVSAERRPRGIGNSHGSVDLDKYNLAQRDTYWHNSPTLFCKKESEEVLRSWKKLVSPEGTNEIERNASPPSVRSTKQGRNTKSPGQKSSGRSSVARIKNKDKGKSSEKANCCPAPQKLNTSTRRSVSNDGAGTKPESHALVSTEKRCRSRSARRYGILAAALDVSGVSTVEAIKGLRRRGRSRDSSVSHRFGIRRMSVSPRNVKK
ncbi:hypothetical protein, conserved [Trypanosoma brucei brucei TREU927]|uniref:Uncharacterized protein n=1 Tax=Trypanosoma brucei brucei (strain 927/4 GUTat10.1) TaxID=185431 RepID=Q38BV3_TRYB2|nr:hypothetical protein, conserved [Trypanosoma brucei brucei TREU927]EAN77717.1 hypothetical protein, conserved [Trypanosoma brucei brucei TREU927]